ncbi:MAG: SpoIIE family protein phosphatase [Actinomycetes bacterium]
MTSAALVLADSASLAPPVHCLCGDESAATAVVCDDAVVILVAEGAGEASGRLANLFEDFARRGTPLGAISVLLDEAVTDWGISGVMATLVEAHAHGFTVLHRGGPTPIVVSAQGTLTRVVAATPGPPLGMHNAVATLRTGETHEAAHGDVLVLTTPSGIDDAVSALAAAAGPTWDDVRYALTNAPDDAADASGRQDEAFALVSFR